MLAPRKRTQRPNQQGILLPRWFGAGDALRDLHHDAGRLVTLRFGNNFGAVGAEQFSLRNVVEGAPLIELHIDNHKRFEPGAKLRGGAPHAFRDGAQLAVFFAEHRDNAVRFAKFLRSEHNNFITIQRHTAIMPGLRENGGVLAVSFSLPLWVDLCAVGIGSLQGAMFAGGFRRIDLLGVAIIGTASGLGGGLLRDMLLGVSPVAFQSNPYLVTATLAALIGMLLHRVVRKLDMLITALDALTIGLFAAFGTTKALSFGLPVVPALLIGCISAVGGSIVRDVLMNLPIALMHVGSLYAVAALSGSGALVLCLTLGVPVEVAAAVCTAVTSVIRMLSVRYGWSLPEQRALSLQERSMVDAVGTSRTARLRPRRVTLHRHGGTDQEWFDASRGGHARGAADSSHPDTHPMPRSGPATRSIPVQRAARARAKHGSKPTP